MDMGDLLCLVRIDATALEVLWRLLSAMPAKTRVVEDHFENTELCEALEPMLGQPAWVVASLLEAVLAERGSFRPGPVIEYHFERHYGTNSPELVWTGSTSKWVPTRSTRYVIEDLFARTQREVLIAGYSFDYATDLFEPLFARVEQLVVEGKPVPKVRIVLDCSRETPRGRNGDALALTVAVRFCETCWTGRGLKPQISYYLPSVERNERGRSLFSMHAKCIVVDEEVALVGSANFSNRARDRNLEVGAVIRDHHFVQCLLAAWEDVEDELKIIPWANIQTAINRKKDN